MDASSLYFTAPRTVEIRPTGFDAGADEVVVETRASGISAGTELLLYRDQVPADPPTDATIAAIEGDLSYPVRYGYAAVGEVVETGSAVEAGWMGRRVFAFNPHETRFAASPASLVPVPADLTAPEMAMLPTVETATSLVLDGRPRVGERVVVFGAGPVGLCTIHALASFPLEGLVAVEPIPERREHARALGADVAVSPADLDPDLDLFDESWIADSGDPDEGSGSTEGADLVYELSGNPTALDEAIGLTGYDSRIVVGSWYGTKRATLDLGSTFHRDRLAIESSQVSTLAPESRGRYSKERRLAVALDVLESLDAASLITHRIPFEQGASAYRLLDREPESALQVVLTYQ